MQYEMFIVVVGALAKLVVAATFVERLLAFVFEHEWYVRLLTKIDPSDPSKAKRVSKIPGLKALVALAVSLAISFKYQFDVLAVLFAPAPSQVVPSHMGMLLTGFILAGGTAGAIAVFQAYLNFGKESRDAITAAGKAEADSRTRMAELSVKEAEAKRQKAEIEKDEAEIRKQVAEASNHDGR